MVANPEGIEILSRGTVFKPIGRPSSPSSGTMYRVVFADPPNPPPQHLARGMLLGKRGAAQAAGSDDAGSGARGSDDVAATRGADAG